MHLSSNIALDKGLLGGFIVGSASAALMLLNGKITGLSGIAKSLVRPEGEEWQYTYNFGLIAAGALARQFFPELLAFQAPIPRSVSVIVTAGLLVGYGTRISGGCTSGHGLCGLSRFSPRSAVAVLTFMASGAVTAYVCRLPEVAPLLASSSPLVIDNLLVGILPTLSILGLSYVYNGDVRAKGQSVVGKSSLLAHLTSLGCALAFGAGLLVSQMVDSNRVMGFLDFLNPVTGWDPTLAGVMGGGVLVTTLTFPFAKKNNLRTAVCDRPLKDVLVVGAVGPNTVIDGKLIVGATLFGAGWGLLGFCPGPALVNLGAGNAAASLFVPSMLLGMMFRSNNFW